MTRLSKLANELDVSIDELTQKYTKIYNEDMAKLNVLPPDVQPKAAEYVKEMVDFIQQLIEGGKAYQKDGHVFFMFLNMPHMEKLSNRAFDQQLAGSRVQVSNIKKINRTLFCGNHQTTINQVGTHLGDLGDLDGIQNAA